MGIREARDSTILLAMNDDALRCDDNDRNRAQALLHDALGRGQISIAEFDERVQKCIVAQTRGELLVPLTDLFLDPRAALYGHPSAPTAPTSPSPATQRPAPKNNGQSFWEKLTNFNRPAAPTRTPDEVAYFANQMVTGENLPNNRVHALFSDRRLHHWTVPAVQEIRAHAGTVTVDLLSARLASHHTTIDVGAAFGEVKILVPEGIRVHIDTDGSFGETTFKVARGAVPPEQLPANAPTLRITGSHNLGSVTVRVLRLA